MGPIALQDRWPRERRRMKPENSWKVQALKRYLLFNVTHESCARRDAQQHRLDQMLANLSIVSAPGRSMSLL